MGLNIGGNIKSIYFGGNVKEIWIGTKKLFPEEESGLVIDGLEYRIAEMPDGRIWMCENLQAAQGSAVFYDNNEATYGRNGKNYGRLYKLDEAKDVANRVDGWHLPSKDEWTQLYNAVGGESIAAKKLKSKTGWGGGGNGTDDFGFSVFPSGNKNYDYFTNAGSFATFWTSTPAYGSNYYSERCGQDYNSPIRGYDNRYNYGFSVRLIKDA